MLNIKKIILIIIPLTLVGCASQSETEISKWMEEETSKMARKIPPIPSPEPYIGVTFQSVGKRDPFYEPNKAVENVSNINAPNPNRRKTVLENYDLANLKMVGYININKKPKAYIKESNGLIYEVYIGDYMGKNYGMIKNISENEIELEEKIMGQNGWENTKTIVELDETKQGKNNN